jgi:hypothetical protein
MRDTLRSAAFVAIALASVIAVRPADACKGCKEPTLTELARQAQDVFAGTVASADKHEHSVVAVAEVWKGAPAKTAKKTGCWRLFEKVGSKVIVLEFPPKWTTPWSDECIGVYADTPKNRETLRGLFGAPKPG